MAEAASDSDGVAKAVLAQNGRLIAEMNEGSGPRDNEGKVIWRGR